MSARVMDVLRQFCPRMEVYSIDEAFLDLTELAIDERSAFGRQIKERVLQYTGIPVSVGIAHTKTLAKIAAEYVKKRPEYQGVLDISQLSEQEMDTLLSRLAAGDIWGIGPEYSMYVKSKGIITARDVKDADERWMRKKLTVVGERIVFELRGVSCLPLESITRPKKSIMSSQSFGRPLESFEELSEALANDTARCAEKLRKQGSLTAAITVCIRTSFFHQNLPQYSNSLTMPIAYPTAFTPELLSSAQKCVAVIYKEGYTYHKAGVSFSHIVSDAAIQPDVFANFSLEGHDKHLRLMAIMDAINDIYGRDTLFFAAQGTTRSWKMKQEKLSGRFTTQWSDILTLH
jgi:DNA polymerase V